MYSATPRTTPRTTPHLYLLTHHLSDTKDWRIAGAAAMTKPSCSLSTRNPTQWTITHTEHTFDIGNTFCIPLSNRKLHVHPVSVCVYTFDFSPVCWLVHDLPNPCRNTIGTQYSLSLTINGVVSSLHALLRVLCKWCVCFCVYQHTHTHTHTYTYTHARARAHTQTR